MCRAVELAGVEERPRGRRGAGLRVEERPRGPGVGPAEAEESFSVDGDADECNLDDEFEKLRWFPLPEEIREQLIQIDAVAGK